MTDKKPTPPNQAPTRRPGTFDGSKVRTEKSFTTNNVPGKIGKPKPGGGK